VPAAYAAVDVNTPASSTSCVSALSTPSQAGLVVAAGGSVQVPELSRQACSVPVHSAPPQLGLHGTPPQVAVNWAAPVTGWVVVEPTATQSVVPVVLIS
jgi:hypothetical protein